MRRLVRLLKPVFRPNFFTLTIIHEFLHDRTMVSAVPFGKPFCVKRTKWLFRVVSWVWRDTWAKPPRVKTRRQRGPSQVVFALESRAACDAGAKQGRPFNSSRFGMRRAKEISRCNRDKPIPHFRQETKANLWLEQSELANSSMHVPNLAAWPACRTWDKVDTRGSMIS
jgi:hypothetical protein